MRYLTRISASAAAVVFMGSAARATTITRDVRACQMSAPTKCVLVKKNTLVMWAGESATSLHFRFVYGLTEKPGPIFSVPWTAAIDR